MTRLSLPLHDCVSLARGQPGLVKSFTDVNFLDGVRSFDNLKTYLLTNPSGSMWAMT